MLWHRRCRDCQAKVTGQRIRCASCGGQRSEKMRIERNRRYNIRKAEQRRHAKTITGDDVAAFSEIDAELTEDVVRDENGRFVRRVDLIARYMHTRPF